MSGLIMIGIWIILIIVLAYVLFWLLGKMGLPEPAALIARIIVGGVCLLLLLGLFIPAIGVRFPGM